ncbi:MAG: 26S protease regulatory subunit [archaeon]|nr:26S protease regulatory subunit [archaeon]
MSRAYPDNKDELIQLYAKRLRESKEMEYKMNTVKENHTKVKKDAKKSEDRLKIIQNTGKYIGEVLKQMDDEKYIIKVNNGPRYIVNCKKSIDKSKLKVGTRVSVDMVTLTILHILPREIDPKVYSMTQEDPGKVGYQNVGGLSKQIRELRETIELPITNPQLFKRIGIKPPKGVLLYGPPGTGKTLLARAIACNIEAKFLKIVASSIIDKYIGESARVVREMFGYARENQPCIIFIDEIDAIGGKRGTDNSSSDREIHRTLMEMLNQIDGFDDLGKVKVIMATNRPDVLDPALLRPGRLDRKIEIPLPNESGRVDILKIHSGPMTKKGEIDLESLAKITDTFNGADLRNVCTEAGMFAIRDQREYVIHEDFMKAARKIKETKHLESKMDYSKV